MEENKSYTGNNNKEQSALNRIGNFIKEARVSRDLSIEELAANLKIGEHQLRAIENGTQDQLPEQVFIKAMVRRIAQKLKLDTEFIMNEFNNDRGEVKIEEIVEEVSKDSDKSKKAKKANPFGFAIFILISVFLGIIASSSIINFLSDSFQNEPPNKNFLKIFKN